MSETPTTWPTLTPLERRVLGVLIEKQKTTPDIYPLSINALVTGCNQKSNRDPILTVDDVAVEDTLSHLQESGLVSRIEGGRVEKWRHHVYERWQVTKEEIAVLAELLLRGPQTEGELRTRASRMEPFSDREALRAVIQPLVQRGLAVWLMPEERRGALLSHGFHDAAESESLQSRHAGGGAAAPPREDRGSTAQASRIDRMQAEIDELRTQIADLRSKLGASQPILPAPPTDPRP
jgi:uncharacterized protein